MAVSDDTEPQPDLEVLRRRDVPYKEWEAWSEDVLLLIEVAETSLRYDRTTKLAIYAETGIPGYWIVDARNESVEVHRDPRDGRYHDVRRLTGSASVTLQAFPDVTLALSEIFA